MRRQVLLDKLLYDLDRGIDRYLQDTTSGLSQAERRAAGYGLLFMFWPLALVSDEGADHANKIEKFKQRAECFAGWVWKQDLESVGNDGSKWDEFCTDVYGIVKQLPESAADIRGLAGGIAWGLLTPLMAELWQDPKTAAPDSMKDLISLLDEGNAAEPTKPSASTMLSLQDELCLQRRAEEQWWELVRAMAAGCGDIEHLEKGVDHVLALGTAIAGLRTPDFSCRKLDLGIPADQAQSLDGMAFNRGLDGQEGWSVEDLLEKD